MKIVRLFEDAEGESHFDEVEIDLNERGGGISVSELLPASGVMLMQSVGNMTMDLHPAPRRQLMIVVRGESTRTASDGETRRFGPGDMLLAEDTTGKGHTSATPTEEGVLTVAVALP